MMMDTLVTVDQALHRLEAGWFTPHGDDHGYDLHSLPLAEFMLGLDACQAVFGNPGTFLDLGCGIGLKMLLAFFRGWTVSGVERHADYADAARRLVPEGTIAVADAHTVKNLTAFDVVYSYRLMVDLDAQHALNRLIVSRMRPGALFFCPGSDPVGLASVGPSVWQVK